MPIELPDPSGPMPDKVIVTVITGKPGAVAIMGDDGIPFTIRPLPSIKRGKLFEPTGILAHSLRIFPDVGVIAKVVIAPDHLALGDAPKDEFLIRGDVGYLYTLLTWLKIPTIVADPGWLARYANSLHDGRSALSIIKEFPDFFEEAHVSEQCARAAILGFIAVTNPDWSGVSVEPRFRVARMKDSHASGGLLH